MKSYSHIDDLRTQYEERKQLIAKRLQDFSAIKPGEYFYELVYCLLTPQSSAINAGRAVEAQKPYPIDKETVLFQMDLAGVRRAVLVPPS